MSILIQSIVNGLNQGAIYALIALGYTMVYGILRMINFAHGDFIMVGAYTMFYTVPLMVSYGMPAWMAVFAAVAVCTAVGVLVERIAYKPVRNSGSISALITALAMSLFLENLAMVLFGGNPKTVTKIFDLPMIVLFGAKIQLKYLLTLGIGLAIKEETAAAMQDVYEKFPRLRERRRQLAGTLSGGEQQMVAVGRALMGKPSIILMDEPSMGLSPLLVKEVFAIIKEIHAAGITVLLNEQNAKMALSIADRAYVLETGTISISGDAQELLKDERVKKAYLGQ